MHSSLFENTQDCLIDSNSLFLDVGFQFLPSNTVEMDAAEREAESRGWGSRVAYTCTKYRYYGFSIMGMALANRILDRT